MKAILLIILFTAISFNAFSQEMYPPRAFVVGNYSFFTKTDTTDYSCTVRVKKDGVQIASRRFEEVTFEDVSLLEENGGDKIFLVSAYTGGAHCCTSLYSISVSAPKINLIDSIYLGNAGYGIEDVDKDGNKEIVSGNDMLAYAFTNYAETRFPSLIFKFSKGHFKDATSEFPAFVRFEIAELTEEMNGFFRGMDFVCEADGTDTFNTPAGTLKTILAAIVADYQTLGELDKGYELLNKNYNCADKEAYINILKNDFKLR